MRLLTRAALFLVTALCVHPASAELIRLTIYDDGLSCPAECGEHVVFHASLNGTEFAHKPTTIAAPFAKCVEGKACRICLESGGKQCLETIYQGGGPTKKTFDFTPAFYLNACAGQPQQASLQTKCNELRKAAKTLEGRVNCIAKPHDVNCEPIIAAARKLQLADRTAYQSCVTIGQDKFNLNRPETEQRSIKCAYERYGTGGPNSKGVTWKKLLPGACRDSTFVGRDGLDCCSGNTLADGPFAHECRAFYPLKPKSSLNLPL
jgi:hypothetical protein